jgi:peptidoglycan hydrolase CwlO-like protein
MRRFRRQRRRRPVATNLAVLVIAATAVLITIPAAASATASSARSSAVPARSRAVAARSRADQAQAAASAAKAKVDALLQRYQDASGQVDLGVAALSAAFAAGASAEVTDDEVAAQERRVRARQATQVRALYVFGGPATLTATVFGASSPDDALWRASTADRVLTELFADTRSQLTVQTDLAVLTRHRVQAAAAATDAQAHALDVLKSRAEDAASALTQAQQTLAALDRRARREKAAEESARQILAAQAAAQAARRTAMGPVTALGIPGVYERAYRAAAATCPGLSWTLLAAVGQVESGHGRNNGPSSAGAIGPMQFMPATFATYAVDGDKDGVMDAWDPRDAIFTAAHYLCASGVDGGSADGVRAALLAYNHAEWYVDLVLAAEQAISTAQAALNAP